MFWIVKSLKLIFHSISTTTLGLHLTEIKKTRALSKSPSLMILRARKCVRKILKIPSQMILINYEKLI